MSNTQRTVLSAILALFLCGGGWFLPSSSLAQKGSTGAKKGGKVDLRLRLVQGKSYMLYQRDEQKIRQVIFGRDQTTRQVTGMGYQLKVLGVSPKKIAHVRVTYRSVYFKLRGPRGQIEYDSRNPPKKLPARARIYAIFVGKSFQMKINPQGQITHLQGVSKLINLVLKELRRSLPANAVKKGQWKMVEASLRKQFGRASIKEAMENLLAIYPKRPVGVGDSWTRQKRSKHFSMDQLSRWTLVSHEGGRITLRVRSKMRTPIAGANLTLGPMKMQYHLRGTRKGTIVLEESTGLAVSGRVTGKIKGKVQIQAARPGQPPRNMSWPIAIHLTSYFKPMPLSSTKSRARPPSLRKKKNKKAKTSPSTRKE